MSITLKTTEFRLSIADIATYKALAEEDTLAEICVVGRSNVGKSSVINLIASRKNLAKTSSTPGRTRLINVFDFCLKVSEEGKEATLIPFALIDLPGYGYAKASKTLKEKWASLIDEYFRESKKIKHVFSLVDIRHPPSELDKQMMKYLVTNGIGFTIIATKGDKIANSQRHKHIQMLAINLGVGAGNIIPTSTLSGIGKQAVIDRLEQVLS
ncbi:MAG: ribosome biogenesis GTP-binding protein YihA/YsxC [Firmicutes bacterium]|nr:ribosome biogenesis GTP-binding protein YihA/YsxC [Bacillota bacterium]